MFTETHSTKKIMPLIFDPSKYVYYTQDTAVTAHLTVYAKLPHQPHNQPVGLQESAWMKQVFRQNGWKVTRRDTHSNGSTVINRAKRKILLLKCTYVCVCVLVFHQYLPAWTCYALSDRWPNLPRSHFRPGALLYTANKRARRHRYVGYALFNYV